MHIFAGVFQAEPAPPILLWLHGQVLEKIAELR
jgi:hypothetical protein